ncbi:MAG: metallophosphoesterase family protein [Nanoarchaeota archaeon]|nr:metallophosphoesterase family protein [Nanoarchaeota archaeon]
MKILFFTDVHSGDMGKTYVPSRKILLKKFDKILEKSKECDVMVCCGDISIFGDGLKNIFEILKKSGKKLFIIHGNHEMEGELKPLCDGNKIVFLHKRHLKFGDVTFAGYGGGGFCDRDEMLDNWCAKLKNNVSGKLVFFSHAPPFNTKLDNLPHLGHRGSMSVREAIEILKPNIFASGHFHDTFLKRDKINNTLLVNPGDEGIILEI